MSAMDANATTKYTAPAWGKSPYEDVELPSGGLVKAKRLDLQILIETGLIDEMDTISGEVNEKVVGPVTGKGPKGGKSKAPQDRQPKKLTKKEQEAKDQSEAMNMLKGDNFKAVSRMLNRLIPAIIVEPAVEPCMVQDEQGAWHMMDDADREDGLIYPDTIPLGDQMHLMNWCMQGMDLEAVQKFRQESDEAVGDVEDESDVRDEAE